MYEHCVACPEKRKRNTGPRLTIEPRAIPAWNRILRTPRPVTIIYGMIIRKKLNPFSRPGRHHLPPAGYIAHDQNRTGDLLLTMQMLYRLSYVGRGRWKS